MNFKIIIIYILFLSNFLNAAQTNISNGVWTDLKHSIVKDDFIFFERTLLQNMNLLNTQDKFGINLLMIACTENKLKFVQKLIDLNAKLDLINEFPQINTALKIAHHNNNKNIEQLLLKAGAKQ